LESALRPLRDQIIEFLRRTLSKETSGTTCALLVE
jgi:hypothetical protein